MRIVQICLRCAEQRMEVTLEDADRSEITIEHLVSHVLLEFFEEILIDEVSLIPSSRHGTQGNLLFIRARYTLMTPPFRICEQDFIELKLEGAVSCPLAELLGEVDVEQVSVNV
ncbi:MAG TPA: hypothetical protein VFA41_00045 [Ktedonobacteraceae bacterium]|jgi:hypothetical protein|nr:hypothetical protein [Ktedonobacteraceae bacterium]